MRVRSFDDDDRRQLYPLIRDYFAYIARSRGVPVGVTLRDAQGILRAWLRKPQQIFLFVLEDEGDLRGFARLRYEDQVYTLDDLGVGEQWRGRGYGAALLRHVEELVREAGGTSVHAVTYPGNLRALDFLITQGYDRLTLVEVRKPVESEPDHGRIDLLGRHFRLD